MQSMNNMSCIISLCFAYIQHAGLRTPAVPLATPARSGPPPTPPTTTSPTTSTRTCWYVSPPMTPYTTSIRVEYIFAYSCGAASTRRCITYSACLTLHPAYIWRRFVHTLEVNTYSLCVCVICYFIFTRTHTKND